VRHTNTRRRPATTRFDAGSPGAVEVREKLEPATRGRVQLVCDFVNTEVARTRTRLIVVGLACLIALVLFPILTRMFDPRVPAVIVGGVFVFWAVRLRGELATSYRKVATKRLIAAINKQLSYRAVSSLSRKEFDSLELFPALGKGWNSRHEIAGRTRDAKFSLHAVFASGSERASAVFQGVIIRLDFSSPFKSRTVVFPDGVAAPAASNGKRDLVLLKSPRFEQMFNTYSNDYGHARQLLSAELMELLVSTPFGARSSMAFVKQSVFVAVPGATLLPDVSLFSAPLTPETAAGDIVRLVTFTDALARAVGAT
jgi:hypothetical protein